MFRVQTFINSGLTVQLPRTLFQRNLYNDLFVKSCVDSADSKQTHKKEHPQLPVLFNPAIHTFAERKLLRKV